MGIAKLRGGVHGAKGRAGAQGRRPHQRELEARQVHDAIRRKRLSNKDLAEATGVDPSTVSRIFSGKRPPSAEFLTKFEHELGVTAEEVYRTLWQ